MLLGDNLSTRIQTAAEAAAVAFLGADEGDEDATGPVILPLPAVLGAVDAIIALQMSQVIDRCALEISGDFFECAKKRRQIMDLIFPLAQVIEKGCDCHGRAALGQSDVKQFYDHVRPLQIYRWCLENGCSRGTCMGFLRLHTCTALTVNVGQAEFTIRRWSAGVLTGTRSAAAAGRIPILDAARHRVHVWSHLAFKTPSRSFALASFVDNLFSTGETIEQVATILDDAGHYLQQKWHLRIGTGSKKLMAAAGGQETGLIHESWEVVRSMKCLGHVLTNTGRCDQDFHDAVRHVWGAWYGNVSEGLLTAPLSSRLKFVRSCIKPVVAFKWAKWPYGQTLASRLDQLHRHLLGNCVRVAPHAGESWDAFRHRRAIITARLASDNGKWSEEWRKAIVTWSQHVQRANDPGNWSEPAFQWHDETWLLEQRLAHSSGGSYNRTRTRAVRGKPATRWFEGLDEAMVPRSVGSSNGSNLDT